MYITFNVNRGRISDKKVSAQSHGQTNDLGERFHVSILWSFSVDNLCFPTCLKRKNLPCLEPCASRNPVFMHKTFQVEDLGCNYTSKSDVEFVCCPSA